MHHERNRSSDCVLRWILHCLQLNVKRNGFISFYMLSRNRRGLLAVLKPSAMSTYTACLPSERSNGIKTAHMMPPNDFSMVSQ